MLLNYTNYELTSFTTNDLAVRNNCVASKQASKQASIVYNRTFSSEGPAFFICRGDYPSTDEGGRAFAFLFT